MNYYEFTSVLWLLFLGHPTSSLERYRVLQRAAIIEGRKTLESL